MHILWDKLQLKPFDMSSERLQHHLFGLTKGISKLNFTGPLWPGDRSNIVSQRLLCYYYNNYFCMETVLVPHDLKSRVFIATPAYQLAQATQ